MFGEQLRKLRLARNISQTKLAKELSVTKQSVSNWENDNIMPSLDLLKKICSFFSCSADYLLELETSRDVPWMIDVSGLTLDEIAHIKQIVLDLQYLEKIHQARKS